MVFMFSLNRGISVGGGGRSYSGVLRNLVSKVVSCCDKVCSSASFDCSSSNSMSRHCEDADSAR